MPYDKNHKWTPDPEDAIYTDPDESKYLTEDGHDWRFEVKLGDHWRPEPPKIVELKKSGKWAKIPPLHRRWRYEVNLRPSEFASKRLQQLQDKHEEIRRLLREGKL
ncbi:MAG: hypothetical protein LBR53_03980 [Deltaproteobacteria bacterium]|jgi:hypothetical protein|nr:hypothetical protein [Deltaproteobacteria bacterium]